MIDEVTGRPPTHAPSDIAVGDSPSVARDQPARARGVELVGRLEGSGFTEDQWLVRRGERFLQLTELLYRIVEATDGIRTLDEVAEAVTEATPWLVSGDQVATLIDTKLVPLGLIDRSADQAAAREAAAGTDPLAALPLGLHIRGRAIPARIVDTLARPLRYLYWPPLLVALLTAIVAGHAWLYLSHGIAPAIIEVLYTPALLLVVIVLMLVAAGFHELGHAAGLIYGGGKVGVMGAGFFLIYPAFYTDVSDSYRLSRWARLRTDLGGIYFHLVAAVALIALYFATGREFLLLAVVLINFEAIRQLIPFVRLDGYWAFADLTGIPDPFSLALPFIRRFIPLPGPRLPQLRPWVSVVFAVFLIAAVPGLLFLLGLFLLGVPVFLTAAWDSAIHQIGQIAEAAKNGEGVWVAIAAVQLVFVSLTALAVGLLVFSLARGFLIPLMGWSAGRPGRRAGVALGTAGVIGVLGLLWLPQLPFLASPPSGTEAFFVSSRTHVERPVTYEQSPPVGGDHAPIWQNCGFYSTPVANENAVHSMEHGAVWITYRPDVSPSERDALRRVANSQIHILVSPYPGLPAPIVASAWGRQLRLDSANDPRLAEFLRAFRLGPDAPERGGPCTTGVGRPE